MHPESTIDRYVAEGLPADAERELRAHLKECAACRAYYDAQRLVFRAVVGDVNEPTSVELRLHSRLAADKVFAEEARAARPRLSLRELFERLFWSPARIWAMGAVAAAVLLIVVVVTTRDGEGAMPLAATVLHAEGARRGEEPLMPGAEVYALDVVEVQQGGIIELELVRGGQVRVFPETRLALGARGESVALDDGKIWCLPAERKGAFEVTTRSASVRVLGTSFVVDADHDKTDVRVVSGGVEVTDLEGRGRVRLQKEESTRVVRGQQPTQPRRANTSQDTLQWQRFVDQLLKNISDGIKSLGRQLQQGGRR